MALTAVFAVLVGYVLSHAQWVTGPRARCTACCCGPPWSSRLGPAVLQQRRGLLPATCSAPPGRPPSPGGPRSARSSPASRSPRSARSALDMTDPQSALGGILSGWFRPAFLLAVVLGTVANNAMTACSSGLALQVVGVRIRRSRSVAIDGTLGVALTLYALLTSNFLDTVASMLQVMVALLSPSMANYATDILLRRNRYDGRDLSDKTRTGPFWYIVGVNWAGATGLTVGTAVASLWLAPC